MIEVSEERKCPECGSNTFLWEHLPCGDHPEIVEVIMECEICDWSEVI